MPKAAARRLRAINSEIAIEAQVTDVTAANVAELMGPADLVIDGTNHSVALDRNDAGVCCGARRFEFTCGGHRLVVFRDGRVLVMGTSNTAEARSLVAKYIGS